MSATHMAAGPAVALVLGALLGGAYVVAVMDRAVGAVVAREPTRPLAALLGPVRAAAQELAQRPVRTERPDSLLGQLAPAAYLGLAAAALAVVPVAEGVSVVDFPAGIVLWGAAESLALIAIFLHGWAPNSPLALIGAYRFVALALSYTLLSMFALIAAALPAETLRVEEIVTSQESLWNVVRQPLGLPLFLVVTLGISFWGPLNGADGRDLAGGTSVESAGVDRLLWTLGRYAMLVAFCAMTATAFLGGWIGPVLPGPAWLVVKTLGVLIVVLWLGRAVGRLPIDRVVWLLWIVLLPVAFLHLLIAGLVSL